MLAEFTISVHTARKHVAAMRDNDPSEHFKPSTAAKLAKSYMLATTSLQDAASFVDGTQVQQLGGTLADKFL